MKNFVTVLTSVFVFLGAVVGEEMRVLEVRENVTALSSIVSLKDLVLNDEVLSDEEQELMVTDSPRFGSEKRLEILDLAYTMQRLDSLLDVKLKGPRYVRIDRRMDVETLNKIKEEIKSELQKNQPWKSWTIDVLFQLADERKLGGISDYERIELRSLDPTTVLGATPLQISFVNEDGMKVEECRISPVILREVKAAIVKRLVKRGEILSRNDIDFSSVWVGNEKTAYVYDLENCAGFELGRRLSPGELIREEHLLRPICTRRGEVLWVTCRMGALEVRMAAKAMETGREGQTVRVENPSSRKAFDVQLTGPKKAVYEASSS